jgi:hypothetical protein
MKETMTLYLDSDYLDYYDSFFYDNFEESDVTMIWKRPFSDVSRSKRKMLKYLEDIRWGVVPWGRAEEFAERMSQEMVLEHGSEIDVIVHFDEYARGGGGMEKMNIFEAAEEYPSALVTLCLEPDEKNVSYRYLRIGSKQFILRREWMEWNNSGADWELLGDETNVRIGQDVFLKELPMFAVDFIVENAEVYAIGFHPSPILMGTPIEEKIPPSEVAYLVKEFCERQYGLTQEE